MQIDTKKQYVYTSSAIRPSLIQEYFPMRIEANKKIFATPLLIPPPPIFNKKESLKFLRDLLENLSNDFSKQQGKIAKELSQRGIPKELALSLYLSDFIHKSKPYTPRNLQENVSFTNLIEYFIKLKYAHCGQKPYALKMLLKEFDISSRVISYSDLFGWTHGFLQVEIKNKWQILDPTFNVYFNIGVEDIIQNPYCERKILSLWSNEFYVDKSNFYENFIKTQIDEKAHTTFKYCREWFMFMGFYAFVPPILYFHENIEGKAIELYDIRKDRRYSFF